MTSVDPARTHAAGAAAGDARETTGARDPREGMSRRTLVKTAAWAVPAVAIAAPAPAFAASPGSTPCGITARFKAWLTKTDKHGHDNHGHDKHGRKQYCVDLIGADPQHPAEGFFWITNAVVGQLVTAVRIIALIDEDIADSAWTPVNAVGDVHWTRPVKIAGPDANGFFSYQIDFRTTSTAVAADGTLPLDARFHFRAPIDDDSVKVKGLWQATVTPSASPDLVVAAVDTVDRDSSGEWNYVVSAGA